MRGCCPPAIVARDEPLLAWSAGAVASNQTQLVRGASKLSAFRGTNCAETNFDGALNGNFVLNRGPKRRLEAECEAVMAVTLIGAANIRPECAGYYGAKQAAINVDLDFCRRIGRATPNAQPFRANTSATVSVEWAGLPGLVAQETLDAVLGVTLLLAPDSGPADTRPLSDFQGGEALGRKQNDASALDVLERSRPIRDDGGQACQVGGTRDHRDNLSHTSD